MAFYFETQNYIVIDGFSNTLRGQLVFVILPHYKLEIRETSVIWEKYVFFRV